MVLVAIGAWALCVTIGLTVAHGWAARYAVLLLIAGLLFCSLRLKPSWRVNFALLVGSAILSLYTVEFALAVRSPSGDEHEQAARMQGVPYDARSGPAVVAGLRQQGIPAVLAMAPAYLLKQDRTGAWRSMLTIDGEEVLPFSGMANTLTVYCNESGTWTMYDSDEHGFHNPKGLWQARVQIVAVGDSFTHGACVPSEQGFIARIRQHYPATVNLAMHANGPLIMLGTLEEYAAVLRPRIVLWCYYEGNDLHNLADPEKQSPLLRGYLTGVSHQHLLDRRNQIDVVLTTMMEPYLQPAEVDRAFFVEQFLKGDHVVKALLEVTGRGATILRDQRPSAPVRIEEPATDEDLQLFRHILETAKRRVAAWGGQLVFVYLPEWGRYRGGENQRQQVLAIVDALGVPLIDIHPAFSSVPDPLALFPFRLHGHYTPEGHRIVAEQIMQALPPLMASR